MTDTARGTLHVFDDAEALAHGAAEWLCDEAREADGAVRICLSGGSTPRHLYEFLASHELSDPFPWARTHWFWGDERFVPHDHPDSNYRMAQEALFDHVPIPPDHIHPIPTEHTDPDAAALAYQHTLRAVYGADRLKVGRPLFNVTLLGIGDDGHTASLLPGGAELGERERWVVPVTQGRPEARITLTYPALDSSRAVAFIVSGAAKRPALARALRGDESLPSGRIRPSGALHWFVDRAAAPAD